MVTSVSRAAWLSLAAVVVYAWSSKVIDPSTAHGRARFTGRMIHYEVDSGLAHWIMRSSVCGLGTFAWAAWAVTLVVLVATGYRGRCVKDHFLRPVMWVLFGVTVAASATMNVPLAIRSVPAFCLLAAALHLLVPPADIVERTNLYPER